MGINLSDGEGLCVAQFVTWVLELCEATKSFSNNPEAVQFPI